MTSFTLFDNAEGEALFAEGFHDEGDGLAGDFLVGGVVHEDGHAVRLAVCGPAFDDFVCLGLGGLGPVLSGGIAVGGVPVDPVDATIGQGFIGPIQILPGHMAAGIAPDIDLDVLAEKAFQEVVALVVFFENVVLVGGPARVEVGVVVAKGVEGQAVSLIHHPLQERQGLLAHGLADQEEGGGDALFGQDVQ